jgi:hypothetical protein
MAIIRPQFNPIQLTTVQTALNNIWKEDNPFLADAPTIVDASQIRRAANKAASKGDLNLFTGLNELAKSLDAGNRTLDTNGDGKLEVFKGFRIPSPDDRTELDKFAGVLVGANNENVTLDADDFPAQTTPTNPLQNIFQQLLSLLGLGGNTGSGSGNQQFGLILILLLFSGLMGGNRNNNYPPSYPPNFYR